LQACLLLVHICLCIYKGPNTHPWWRAGAGGHRLKLPHWIFPLHENQRERQVGGHHEGVRLYYQHQFERTMMISCYVALSVILHLLYITVFTNTPGCNRYPISDIR